MVHRLMGAYGATGAALDDAELSITEAEEVGDEVLIARARHWTGVILARVSQLDRARELLSAAIQAYDANGLEVDAAIAPSNMAAVSYRSGNSDGARRRYLRALSTLEGTDERFRCMVSHLSLIHI